MILARVCLIVALLFITWISLVPSPPEVSVMFWDKLNHFISFFTLALLTYFSVSKNAALKNKLINNYMAYILLLAYGISIEILQWGFSSNLGQGKRYFELMDIVADGVGIIAFVLVLSITQKLLKKAT
ncbi:MAG: VanZ family protein [Candidatus Azotimanducaceae bacterium]|jgi:VanZ family protein